MDYVPNLLLGGEPIYRDSYRTIVKSRRTVAGEKDREGLVAHVSNQPLGMNECLAVYQVFNCSEVGEPVRLVSTM